MCIAILNVGEKLTDDALFNSWESNNDGAGIGYIDDGKLVVEKFPSEKTYGLRVSDEFKKFLSRYNDIYEKHSSHPILVHFRISTSGFSDEMLHPFTIGEDLLMMHNGVIPNLGNNEVSDTKELADILAMSNAPQNIISDPAVNKMLIDIIGYSKLVFLDNEGEYHIVNEQMGYWETNGNWFSNTSHKGYSSYKGYSRNVHPKGALGDGGCSVGKCVDGGTSKTISLTHDGSLSESEKRELCKLLDESYGFGAGEDLIERDLPLHEATDEVNCKGCWSESFETCKGCVVYTGDTNDDYLNSFESDYEYEGDEMNKEAEALAKFFGFCSECGSTELMYDPNENKVYCFSCNSYPKPYDSIELEEEETSSDKGVDDAPFEYDDENTNLKLV